MLEQYVKLFHLGWIEPWMAKALIMIGGSLLLVLIVCKTIESLNRDQQ